MNSALKCNQENGIRIFNPMLFEDTVVSKIMEDFNTKCYVMNNEEKLSQQKQSLETLFLLMKKTRAKKFKVYHLRNLFWGFFGLGVLSVEFCQGVHVRGGGLSWYPFWCCCLIILFYQINSELGYWPLTTGSRLQWIYHIHSVVLKFHEKF